MKETKRRFGLYALCDCTGTEKHLKKMAEKGWMLESIGAYFWKYRRVEPQSGTFSVLYYPKKVYEGEMTAERQQFINDHSVAGWELVADKNRAHIFYNKSENPVPLETDAKVRIKNIHGFAKSYEILGSFIGLIAILLYMIWFAYRAVKEPIDTLSDELYGICFLPLCIPFSICDIIRYFIWYKKAKTAAEDGIFTETKRLFFIESCFVPVYLVGSYVKIYTFLSPAQMLFGAVAAVFGILLIVLFNCIRRMCSKKAVTAVIAVVLVACFVAGSAGIYTLFPKRSKKITTAEGKTVEVYCDKNLPLDLEDLTPVEGVVSKYKSNEWLGFINITETMQVAPDSGELSMACDVYQINFAPVYGACVEEIKGIFAKDYVEVDPAPWGADKVYRIKYDDGYGNSFVICWEDRIADISFSWNPTDEQIAVASKKILDSHK